MNRIARQGWEAAGTDPEFQGHRPVRRPRSAWIQVAGDGFLGITSVVLAASPGVADGRVVFAGEGWRMLLGGLGVLFTLVFVRSVGRLATGYRPRLDPDTHRKTRLKGKIYAAIGLWFLAVALVPALAERTISFAPWLKVGYGIAGGMNLLVGLAVQWDPTRHIQNQRVRAGEGVRGRARILRANDTGTQINGAPRVKIDLLVEPEGRTAYEATDKVVVQQAKLALLIPGSSLGVVVDRDNPRVFHLDWDDWQSP